MWEKVGNLGSFLLGCWYFRGKLWILREIVPVCIKKQINCAKFCGLFGEISIFSSVHVGH